MRENACRRGAGFGFRGSEVQLIKDEVYLFSGRLEGLVAATYRAIFIIQHHPVMEISCL